MGRVFLSYARQDEKVAQNLAEALSGSHHEVWWDRNLLGGCRFSAEIDRALKEADAVVVLWSEASVQSAWVHDEAAEGRDTGRLVPVSLGSIRAPLGFRQFQTIQLGDEPQTAVRQIHIAIERICGVSDAGGTNRPLEAAQPRNTASICVLPFMNMSGEPEQEYFSDGITEDITTDLSKVSALEVVARNTAFSFKGKDRTVFDVATQLGVSYVLEGSVRKAGTRLRISAQLIDGHTGKHLWADRFDRDLTDIFAIQDEISAAIVEALKVRLLPAEKEAIASRGTSNVDAYNVYLMARQQWVSGEQGNPRREESIVRLCEQAARMDPTYAEALALMGLAQAELRFWHGRDEDALPTARRALEIKPQLAEAHCVLARYLEDSGDAKLAEKQIETAIQLDPDSWEVNREAARMLFRQGHIRESIFYFEKAASLMDTDWNCPMILTSCYEATGDEPKMRMAAQVAIDRAERAMAHDPTNGSALASGAICLAVLGQTERAREWIQRALLLDPDNLNMRYNVVCAQLLIEPGAAEAVDTLEPWFKCIRSSSRIRHAEADPSLNSIRQSPRFQRLLAAAKKRVYIGDTATE